MMQAEVNALVMSVARITHAERNLIADALAAGKVDLS